MLTLRLLDRPGDDALVQGLLETDPGYTERVTGYPPGPSDGHLTLTMVPAGIVPEDKYVLGLSEDDRLVGLLDLVRGYPDVTRAFLGLLLVDGARQGEGLGRLLHGAGQDLARGWPDVRLLRLAVVQSNASVEPFWERLGYRRTGEEKPWEHDSFTSTSVLFERQLDRPEPPEDVPAGAGWVIDGATLRPRITDLAAFRDGLREDPLAEAIEALWTGDARGARALLEGEDQRVRVRALLADCLRDLGDVEEALRRYVGLVAECAETPREPVLRQHHGKALLAAGRAGEAHQEFVTAYDQRLRRGAPPDQVASSAQARDRAAQLVAAR